MAPFPERDEGAFSSSCKIMSCNISVDNDNVGLHITFPAVPTFVLYDNRFRNVPTPELDQEQQ